MSDEPNEVQDQDAPESSLRDELSAAFDSVETSPDAGGDREPGGVSDREPGHTEPEAGDVPARERSRDQQGRYAKEKPSGDHGAAPEGRAKPAGVTTPPASPLAAPAPAPTPGDRAPQSWKPAAREHWGALPPDVRAEVQRRESEVGRVLQESAQARKVADGFRQAYAPYEAMIRAEGSDPLRAVGNLFQTAAALRTAPPAHKAALVAQIVRSYGVPIDALDAALAGQPMPQGQPQPQGLPHDPRVDQLFARLDQITRDRQQSDFRSAQSEVDKFGSDKEFFGDLRPLMADVIEIAANRGEVLDLPTAYERALAMRPDINQIVAQRKAAANAANRQRSTQRARAAASSVKSDFPSAPVHGREKASLRDDLEEAFEQASGR